MPLVRGSCERSRRPLRRGRRPSGSCVGDGPPSLRAAGPPVRRRRAGAAVAALAPRVFELSEFLHSTSSGSSDVGAYYPHRVAYHPSCHSLRMLQRRRGAAAAAAPGARHRPGRAARGATCCGFGGTFAVKNADTSAAMLADKIRSILDTGAEVCTALDSSCLMHIGGGLSRQRTGVRTVHFAEILATERTTGAPPVKGSRRPPATSWRTRSFATTSRHATHTIRDKRARAVAELDDWEQLREAGRRIKDAGDPPSRCPSGAARAQRRGGGRHGPLGGRRRRGQRDRHRARRRPPAPPRWSRSNRSRPTRSGSTRRSHAAGHHRAGDRPGRADHPAGRRPSVPHPRAGDPLQPRRDPRRCSVRELPGTEALTDDPAALRRGRAQLPAREFLSARWRSAAPTSRSPRPAPSCVRRVRGQRPHVHDAAARR